jgi:hypothetical protein
MIMDGRGDVGRERREKKKKSKKARGIEPGLPRRGSPGNPRPRKQQLFSSSLLLPFSPQNVFSYPPQAPTRGIVGGQQVILAFERKHASGTALWSLCHAVEGTLRCLRFFVPGLCARPAEQYADSLQCNPISRRVCAVLCCVLCRDVV